jgi:hypothetical protein
MTRRHRPATGAAARAVRYQKLPATFCGSHPVQQMHFGGNGSQQVVADQHPLIARLGRVLRAQFLCSIEYCESISKTLIGRGSLPSAGVRRAIWLALLGGSISLRGLAD